MEAAFLRILNMSITASYVILAVVLMRLLLKRAPKKYAYLLWGVVAFRLVCPVSFQSIFSLFSLRPFDMSRAQSASHAALEYIPGDIAFSSQPRITVGIPAANAFLSDSLPAATPAYSVNPLQVILTIGTILWCIGMLTMVVYGILSYGKIRHRMATAIRLEGNVYESDRVQSPFILGFFRPNIYIPFGLDEDTKRYVLTHENHHIRRLDHIIKPFAFLLLTVHWFNPLCWLAFFLMGKDMEMSCDEKVLGKEENIRKAYSTSLLSFASNRRFPSPSPLAFGETGVKSRIKNALSWRQPKVWITVLAAVLCLAVVVACAANPRRGLGINRTKNPIESAIRSDYRTSSEPDVQRLNNAQLEELTSRLEGIRSAKRSDEYGGFTPFFHISAFLSDDTWMQINGYDLEGKMVDICHHDKRYVVKDADFAAYLSRICAGADTAAALDALSGTGYVSAACLYLNPLSSSIGGSDTGYRYLIDENYFLMMHRTTGQVQSITCLLGDWRPFPYTEKEWAALFKPEGFHSPDISTYQERLFRPLSDRYTLLRMDGQFWLVEMRENSQMDQYVWSIHLLIPESALAGAAWEYQPHLSSRYPAFPFRFDLGEDVQIYATCQLGQLLDQDNNRIPAGGELELSGNDTLYWSPGMPEAADGTDPDSALMAMGAQIQFRVSAQDVPLYDGTIYLTLDETVAVSGGGYYIAALSANGLMLQQDIEGGGGVIFAQVTEPSLAIIGGADGPTQIFVTGKNGK